jgi:hypothetical protein
VNVTDLCGEGYFMSPANYQISRRDGVKFGFAAMSAAAFGTASPMIAVSKEKSMNPNARIDRLSITCSKPFDVVCAALRSTLGQPDISDFI